MSKQDDHKHSVELVLALLRSVPPHYTSSYGRWVWVAGKLASMIVRWARYDMTIRQEVEAIVEQGRRRAQEDE